MKLNKKVIESITVCGLCAMLTVTAVTNSGRSEVKAEDKVLANTGLEHTGYNRYNITVIAFCQISWKNLLKHR